MTNRPPSVSFIRIANEIEQLAEAGDADGMGIVTSQQSKRCRRAGWGKRPSGFVALAVCLALGFGAPLAGCRAEPQPWPLWQAYAGHFIDDQGRVIDRSAGDRTTSEGQAYALFFALVDNDQARFAKLLKWTEVNLAGGDLTVRLPAWNWGKTSGGEWKVRDDNPASDADLWLAFTLLEAGRLWHDPRYANLGKLVAARIAKEEVVLVPGVGTALIPGPHGFHPDEQTYVLNPSYMPLPVLTYLAKTLPDGPWAGILETLPRLLSSEVGHGFAMDWVSASPDGVHAVAPPAEPTAGAREAQAAGSYDAIRVYLWLGIADPGTRGARELLASVSGMASSLRVGVTPPLEVDAQGVVLHAEAPVGFSAAIIPYLQAVGMKAPARLQQDRLAASADATTGLYGRGEYYDENLVLFSTGWSERKYRFEASGKLRLNWK
jgi:endo-1,4-beta-D-glucanase Y